MNVQEYYKQTLAERGYQSDAAQQKAVDRMQLFYDEFVEYKKARSSVIKKIPESTCCTQGLVPVGWGRSR